MSGIASSVKKSVDLFRTYKRIDKFMKEISEDFELLIRDDKLTVKEISEMKRIQKFLESLEKRLRSESVAKKFGL